MSTAEPVARTSETAASIYLNRRVDTMSDSELSDAPARRVPSDEALEKALRKETAKQFEDPLKSVNSIRRGAEDALDLDTGFFADDEAWKARSKAVIKKEIVSQCFPQQYCYS